MDKMDLLLQKMDDVVGKVNEIDSKVDRLEVKVDRLDERVSRLEVKVDQLDERVGRLEMKAVQQVEWNYRIENRLKNIEVSIENELLFGIHVIGEGHLDLGKKLDAAVESSVWREETRLRLLHFESEIRRIKENCKKCA